MSEEKKKTLKRTFGMREAVTITVGTVVGVGLFTTGANVVGDLGPAVILATLVAMLISIYPSLLYAEMGAALPYAGWNLPICFPRNWKTVWNAGWLELYYFTGIGNKWRSTGI